MRILNKKAAVAGTLLMSLALTGCFQEVPSDQDRKPATSAPTKAARGDLPEIKSEEELPVLEGADVDPAEVSDEKLKEITENNKEATDKILADIEAKPFGIDTKVLVEKGATPEVKEVFSDFDTAEGARFSLNYMNQILSIGNFYKPRDTARDYEYFVGLEDQMTDDLKEALKEDIIMEGRSDFTPSATSTGSMGHYNGEEIFLMAPPIYKVWANEVSVDGKYLRIDGSAEVTWLTKDQKRYVLDMGWTTLAVPSGEKDWAMDNFAWVMRGVK